MAEESAGSEQVMPRMDGMELLNRLRRHSELPVIFLTSKDDEQDEEAGLELGADDYIAKPFSLRLLLARIRAILRRTEFRKDGAARPAADDEEPGEALMRGRLTMDPARHPRRGLRRRGASRGRDSFRR